MASACANRGARRPSPSHTSLTPTAPCPKRRRCGLCTARLTARLHPLARHRRPRAGPVPPKRRASSARFAVGSVRRHRHAQARRSRLDYGCQSTRAAQPRLENSPEFVRQPHGKSRRLPAAGGGLPVVVQGDRGNLSRSFFEVAQHVGVHHVGWRALSE
jgi:hypothetical protein